MKISRLAENKLRSFFGDGDYLQEMHFVSTYILPVIGKPISHGLTLPEVELFCRRCEEFEIDIVGLETLYESPYGLHTLIVEEYCEHYQPEWWLRALADLQTMSVLDHIIPHIEIPPEVLSKYI